MTATLIPDLERDLTAAADRRARPRRGRRWCGLAAVGAVLVAGGATAAVVTNHHDSADPRVRAELGVLRRPVSAEDALPGQHLGQFRSDEARRARTAIKGWKAWVVPSRADGSACLFAQPPGTGGPGGATCFRVKDIVRARQGKAPHPMTQGLRPHGVAVVGLVPDGIDHVTVTRSDGTKFDAPVLDNVYIAVSTTHSTATVSYEGATGPVTSEAWSPGYLPPPARPTAAERKASDRARSDPSKPRRVRAGPVIQPRGGITHTGGPRTLYWIDWRTRITGGAYSVRIRGPRCSGAHIGWLPAQRLKYSRRGRILSMMLAPPGKLYTRHGFSDGPTPEAWCHGTYKVDVAWVGNGHRYAPFGTGTFTVR